MKRIFALFIAFIMIVVCPSSALFAAATDLGGRPGARGEGFYLDPAELTIPVFSSETGVRLRAYVNGVFRSAYNFTWSSSDTSVATVDDIGNVYAEAPGSAVITATGAAGAAAHSEAHDGS